MQTALERSTSSLKSCGADALAARTELSNCACRVLPLFPTCTRRHKQPPSRHNRCDRRAHTCREQHRTSAGQRRRVIRGPGIDQALQIMGVGEDHPTGSATFSLARAVTPSASIDAAEVALDGSAKRSADLAVAPSALSSAHAGSSNSRRMRSSRFSPFTRKVAQWPSQGPPTASRWRLAA